jgi:hypothetical protein
MLLSVVVLLSGAAVCKSSLMLIGVDALFAIHQFQLETSTYMRTLQQRLQRKSQPH